MSTKRFLSDIRIDPHKVKNRQKCQNFMFICLLRERHDCTKILYEKDLSELSKSRIRKKLKKQVKNIHTKPRQFSTFSLVFAASSFLVEISH